MSTTIDSKEPRAAPVAPGWLDQVLPQPPARILDAGCGTGALAVTLGHLGYDVTAIDVDPVNVAAAREGGVSARRADIADYDDEPFDAIVCCFSLHHMQPLEQVVDRMSALLSPGGSLLIDEFAWDWADRGTAAWFYDTADLLVATELIDRDRPDPGLDPRTRWCDEHADLAAGDAMIEAVAERLTVTHLERTAYLARSLGGRLEATPRARLVRAELERIERDRIDRRMLTPIGFHLVARNLSGADPGLPG